MAKVYVSSTIADLKRERRAVMDWLVDAQHQVVHSYRPNSDTVRESCLDDVDACDLYVLILGHRYGFQPAQDYPEGLSITQLEFRRAGESGIPRVALVRTSIPDVSLSDMEDPQRAALVLAFRAEVAREVRAAEFSDLAELIGGLSTGVAAELARRGQRPDGGRAAGPVLRLAPRLLLTGREELLAAVDGRLAGGADQGPRVVALHGLGGAGKTSMAVEYVYRHLDQVGVAWQLPAEDATVLEAGFSELAAQLGAQVAAGDPVAAVHSALAASPVPWMLIFDNARGQGPVQRFLPPAGTGRVLITSQSAAWPRDQAVEVPPLGTEVAAMFLVSRTGDPASEAAVTLADELGGLPLALEQAAAYIQATGTTLTAYLSVFRDREAELLARGEAAGHPADVAATLGLALSRLEEEAPPAAEALRLLACLAPEPVPLKLLLADARVAGQLAPDVAAAVGPLLGDPVAVGDAVAALRRYSLITPAGDGLVLVHRLVQAITAEQMPVDLAREWQQAAAALIEDAIPSDTDPPKTWAVCAALLPHTQAALADGSAGMARIANYLGRSGSYAASRDLQVRVLGAREQVLGPEHPETLSARHELARWTGFAGDPATAQDLLAALLPVRERTLGPEHPDTLTTRLQLARWTGEAGDPATARDLLAALLPVRERVSSPQHPDTLAARANLARWTGEAGDAAGARDRYTDLVPVDERVLGPEHPDTLAARANIARWTGEAGDAAAARDLLAALLSVDERVLGPEHPNTLAARANIARWTGQAGNSAAARDLLAALLPALERILGPEHPDTLDTRHQLARWTGHAGNAADARDRFAALLPVREQVLGPEHPDTLDTRHQLAHWTGKAGDAAGARDRFAALQQVRERLLGPEHPDTLNTLHHVAVWAGRAGNAAGALGMLAVLLPERERLLGADHPGPLNTRNEVAIWTGEAGNAASARDMLAVLLPERERVLGPEHPRTLNTRHQLARWTGAAGDAAGARDRFAALLPERERLLGAEHPDTLNTRNELAIWTGYAEDAASARDQFVALLPVRERVAGPEHPETLSTRHNLAYFTGLAGDAAEARDQYAALLPVYERVLGPEHPDTLTAGANLAYFTGMAGDAAGARDQFAALLPVRERVSGPEHPDTLTARANLASWTEAAGKGR